MCEELNFSYRTYFILNIPNHLGLTKLYSILKFIEHFHEIYIKKRYEYL